MNDASRVLVALRVRVPAERAFAAFTDRIADWWQPNGIFQFTPGQVGTMVFEPGPRGRLLERYGDGTEFVIGQVRAWEPPRHLVLGWRHATFAPDQDTELHITFDEISGDPIQTRVTVEHFGWDRLPPQSAARHGIPLVVFQHRFAEWWQRQLQAVAAATETRSPTTPLR